MSALLSDLDRGYVAVEVPVRARPSGSAPVRGRRPGAPMGASRLRLRCSRAGRRPAAAALAPVRASAQRVPAQGRPALHLTRRGRLVVLLLLLAFLSVAFGAGRVTSTALGNPDAPGAAVVVHRGDTLWSIAGRIAPHRDPRSVSAELMEVNGLGTPSLEVGQRLRLP